MGVFMSRLITLIAALLLPAAAALAQTAPVSVQFVGTITGSAADTLMIRGPGGTSTPWTGPLPEFPYLAGDQITVSFNATPGSAVQSADGLYRYTIVGPSQTGGASGSNYALTGSVDVSGPITGGYGVGGLTLVYNAATSSYSLEMPQDRYTMWTFDGPGYLYDRAAGSLSLTSTTRQPGTVCSDQTAGCFNITGDMTSGMVDRAPVWGTDGSLAGFFSVLFSGNWFVNGQQVGGATQVPEPGQLLLFALTLAFLGWAYHRRLQGAD